MCCALRILFHMLADENREEEYEVIESRLLRWGGGREGEGGEGGGREGGGREGEGGEGGGGSCKLSMIQALSGLSN